VIILVLLVLTLSACTEVDSGYTNKEVEEVVSHYTYIDGTTSIYSNLGIKLEEGSYHILEGADTSSEIVFEESEVPYTMESSIEVSLSILAKEINNGAVLIAAYRDETTVDVIITKEGDWVRAVASGGLMKIFNLTTSEIHDIIPYIIENKGGEYVN
jgi:hypothetical protein